MDRNPPSPAGGPQIAGRAFLIALALGALLVVGLLFGGSDSKVGGGTARALTPAFAHRTQLGARKALSPTSRRQLASARAATAKYRDAGRAVLDGYRLFPGRGCVTGSTGLMGYHFVNSQYVHDGRHDLGRPDYLLYAPTPGGGFELAGVEWEEPYRGQAPPKLFGQEFDGPMAGHVQIQPAHYDLHVFLQRANPAGMFTRYNPALRCCPPERPGAAGTCPDKEAPFLGAGGLSPRTRAVRSGVTARWQLTWTHPDDRSEVAQVVVRLRDGRTEVGRAILDPATGTIRDAAGMVAVRARAGGGTPDGAGEPARRLTAQLTLRLPRALAGRRLTAELVVRDRRGREQQLRRAATIDVRDARGAA